MTALTAPISLSSLPSHPRDAGREGYIYAVELSTGVVKVGKSRNPRSRVGAHMANAACYGITVTNVWLSPRHVNYSENERLLIAALGPAEYRSEYFRVAFAQATSLAEALHFELATEEERAAQRDKDCDHSRRLTERFRLGQRLIAMPDGMQAVFVPDDIMAWPLRLIFEPGLPDAFRRSSPTELAPLIDELVERLGKSREELLDWSYIEIVEHLTSSIVRAGCLDLKYRALLAGRTDMTDPAYWGDALEVMPS